MTNADNHINDVMTNEEFDKLWEQASVEGRASRLAAEYPAWHRRQRRVAGLVAALLLVVAVTTPMVMKRDSASRYEKVYCNRIDKNNQQWVDMADYLLMNA